MISSTDISAGSYVRQRRRVLVLFGNAPLLGQERGNIQVFYALKKRGVDALFVTNREWGGDVVQPALDSLELNWTVAAYVRRFQKGMGLREWVRNIWRVISGSFTLCKLIIRYKPTHIHISNSMHFVNFLPVLVLTRVPIVYRLGDVPETHRKVFRMLWTKAIVPRVSTFVCISEYVKSSISALGVADTKCRVIYNEAPVRIHTDPRDDLPKLQKLKAFTVLFVGQLSRRKGIDVLVQAAMELCRTRVDIEFLIAGDYEWKNALATDLKDTVRVAGLQDRIRFLGYIDAMQELYSIADLHVLPSVWEGEALSNVVIEAKHAGIPSVVFPSGGVPEVVSHEVDGYICADRTSASLIAGIEYYIDSPGRSGDHGENAQSSLGKLGIRRFGELWDDVYATR